MIIELKTDRAGFYYRYYELMNPYFKLAPLERRTLALIAKEYNSILGTTNNEKISWRLALDYDSRAKMREELGDISFNSFANILTSLRKKGILVNNKIPSAYLLNESDTSLTFKFVIDESRQDDKEHSQ